MKRRFQIIILLMALSLLGIILIQVFWLRHAIKAEEDRFDKSVYNALEKGISRLEREKVFHFIDRKIDLPAPPPPGVFDSLTNIYLPDVPEIEVLISDSGLVQFKSGSTVLVLDSSGKKKIYAVAAPGRKNIHWETDVDVDQVEEQVYTYEYSIDLLEDEEIDFLEPEELLELEEIESLREVVKKERFIAYQQTLDSLEDERKKLVEVRAKKKNMVKRKMDEFNKSMQQWAFEYSMDEEKFATTQFQTKLDTMINRALRNNGIQLEFYSQITKEYPDSTIIVKPAKNGIILSRDEAYLTEMFPGEFFRNNYFLFLQFPGKTGHIYQSVAFLGFGSLLFTTIILITFGLTIYYIQKQKRISDIKSDFINNMTHEFKTPIATINLASDAMGSPKVIGNHDKTQYYLDIIKHENKRMNSQVERVLQMALIESKDFHLDLQKTDLHVIIENTINAVQIAAAEKDGRIQSSLRATCSEVSVDEIHFSNILNNLLDNALKYCDKKPEILVESYSNENKIFIRISDNGVGMSKEVQKHIFDKFYRKPSGNIHNVKGFGLGLSYVKAIVDAHDGEITVHSEPGNGSIFTLGFNC